MDGSPKAASTYFTAGACALDDLASLCAQTTQAADVPHAAAIEENVPLYDISALQDVLDGSDARRALMAEWARVLSTGPGIVVLKNACPDHAALDAGTIAFNEIIDAEARSGAGGGDHFAKPGANARIWNALQKLCLHAPETYARVFASPAIAAVAEAWLGPHYQMTAQVNLVRPGGAAQTAHRDYHLGFLSASEIARFPAHVHALSPALTLQGAIAHIDVSIESGPTKLLPYSQAYPQGYTAIHRDDFRDFFEAHHIQLPLQQGDALFFNPATFHAAGKNHTTDVHRLVNLLQIGSAFGRSIEAIDRTAMCKSLYPVAQRLKASGRMAPAALDAVIAATAEGYAFPTNLDTDPPLGGLAPQSQAALFRQALAEDWAEADLHAALAQQDARRAP